MKTPLSCGYKPTPKSSKPEQTPSIVVGRLPQAVGAAVLGGIVLCGCATPGITYAAEDAPPPPPAETEKIDAKNQEAHFDELIEQLEDRRDRGEITPEQFQQMKNVLLRELQETYGDLSRLGLEIDFDALVDDESEPISNQTQVVLERLARQLEARMRVTARDMANPNTKFLEGNYGYKKIPEKEVLRLVESALKDIPIGDFPGGDSLANIITQLPGAGRLNAANMSYKQLEKDLSKIGKTWLKTNFEPFLKKHKIEAAVVGFGAVTALRYASPDAAELMDKVDPRITIYRGGNKEANVRARLSYRDRHILPDLDLNANVYKNVGPTRLHAGINGTISAESDDIVDGSVTVGANLKKGNAWIDSSATYYYPKERTRLNLNAGLYDPDSKLSVASDLTATLGKDVAHGDANGRIQWELDVNRKLELKNADASFGFFAGMGMDTDGDHKDVRAGVMFRLKW